MGEFKNMGADCAPDVPAVVFRFLSICGEIGSSRGFGVLNFWRCHGIISCEYYCIPVRSGRTNRRIRGNSRSTIMTFPAEGPVKTMEAQAEMLGLAMYASTERFKVVAEG